MKLFVRRIEVFKWIKKKLGIVAISLKIKQQEQRIEALSRKMEHQSEYIAAKVAELREYTRVDADIGVRGNNTIILSGVYRGKGYVRFYDVGEGEFLLRGFFDL